MTFVTIADAILLEVRYYRAFSETDILIFSRKREVGLGNSLGIGGAI